MLRLRFPLAVSVCTADLGLWMIFWRLRYCPSGDDGGSWSLSSIVTNLSSPSNLTNTTTVLSWHSETCHLPSQHLGQVLVVWLLMTLLCLYGGWSTERATRRDFSLQVWRCGRVTPHLLCEPVLTRLIKLTLPRQIDLTSEREKSKAMLDNMLPPHISHQLAESQSRNSGGALIASTEPNVTVLFCDILDFHQIGPSLTRRGPCGPAHGRVRSHVWPCR